MNEIKINSYRVVDNGNKKPYCVYIVHARINNMKYEVEKRYSQFLSLHNEVSFDFMSENEVLAELKH